MPPATPRLLRAAPAVPAGPDAPPDAQEVPFARRLAEHGERVALRVDGRDVTYARLAGLVAAARARLGPTRRLVLLPAARDVPSLVAHLACLADGHPVLLADPGDPARTDALVARWDPDVVVGGPGAAGGGTDQPALRERRAGTRHRLHPELAVLLPTSGSTGAPRVARLPASAVQASAEAVVATLGLRPDDRTATTLPSAHAYGLSVLHSHLLVGATLVLTDASVVDPCFARLAERERLTTLAGVPHTFTLLDRAGLADRALPDLRLLTCAGGRLAPDDVVRHARLARQRGRDLVLMYGQTEATGRLAVLPPDLAESHPGSVGLPLPGTTFSLDEVPAAELPEGAGDAGELVVRGPTVMHGYAEGPADLARGRDVGALRTGDLARRTPDGLWEVVGRRGRSVKVAGTRVDLDAVSRGVAAATGEATAVALLPGGPDAADRVGVLVEGEAAAVPPALAAAREASGLPASALHVVAVPALPRTAAGKPDGAAVLGALRTPAVGEPSTRDEDEDVAALVGRLLGRPDATGADTFVALGGDSLSYVEVSVALEERLGHLPGAWHLTPLAQLGAEAPAASGRRRSRWRSLETGVVLRALAIVAIVGTHGDLFLLLGGAHVLLAVAGATMARFRLTGAGGGERSRAVLASAARVAVPTAVWAAVGWLVLGRWDWYQVLGLNWLLGPEEFGPTWQLWFVEALLGCLLLTAALLVVPGVDRLERRAPFGLPVALVAVALLTRFEVVDLGLGPDRWHSGHVVVWLFLLGWAVARTSATWHRLLVSALLLATVPGFFGDPRREAVVVAGVLALVWVRTVRLPAVLARPVAVLAAATLYIYLTHWFVYPPFEDSAPLVGVVLSLLVGVAAARVAAPLLRRGEAALRGAGQGRRP